MKSIDDPGIALPEGKRRELERVVALLREGFAEAVAERRAPRFRDGKLLKIILFGSYARGDWVEDPVGRYFSDYDILVVVDHEDLTDVPEFWLKTEDRLLAEVGEGKVRTPVSVIYHSFEDVNDKLKLGRYFFTDIVKDGIVLFEEPGRPFETPRKLTPAEALKETQDYYEEWFNTALEFVEGADFHLKRGHTKLAAFNLHQAAERFYHTLFLVRTLYSPKTHNLNRLRSQTEALEPRLREVWPGSTKFERRCYELLRAAYVKARYSRQYRITAEELDWIGSRVEVLRGLIEELCLKRLDELERAA
ncbi:HEPN domain-containing protein [Sphingosinicella microcystinivorans]|uniref:Nucleotidyltransferase n=1 Tax=Sphingosinicella microcystinivorans TaxID=335406 RepID=A0AAD1D438_SPHMI|nr:HEPN domain-containing protein [Sphingosinicella microcystinivorans]RKS90515.1 nucleotidyltransferase-like protein [Sphingosinicella microcystinivorans]BBE33428.1 nucleotidyltransferase [Sphingosinicella microcystinivorans]